MQTVQTASADGLQSMQRSAVEETRGQRWESSTDSRVGLLFMHGLLGFADA